MPALTPALVADFYRQQHDALVSYLYRKLGSLQEAADVAQQTYERLLSDSRRRAISNPRAFVYKTATNLAIDHLRKRRVRGEGENPVVGDEDFTDGGPSPDRLADNALRISLVRRFVAELSPKCRYAFLAYKFGEQDYAEIAESLGVSESMVRKYVLRAINYCRERLEAAAEHGEPTYSAGGHSAGGHSAGGQ